MQIVPLGRQGRGNNHRTRAVMNKAADVSARTQRCIDDSK
jgi:hypothetical protein